MLYFSRLQFISDDKIDKRSEEGKCVFEGKMWEDRFYTHKACWGCESFLLMFPAFFKLPGFKDLAFHAYFKLNIYYNLF